MECIPMYMAVDQYGQTFHGLRHPHKDLCAQLYCQHAEKMYEDNKNGQPVHVGYVIAGHWLRLYRVIPFEGR